LERETGIEPATNGLGSRYSTIELLPLGITHYTEMHTLEVPCCPDYDFVVPSSQFGEDGKGDCGTRSRHWYSWLLSLRGFGRAGGV
jgi:hypothetical protein